MANLAGTNVAATVLPFTDGDTFATHDAAYGKGGHRTVATFVERNAIPVDRRELLMTVAVVGDGKTYKLITNPAEAATVDADWEEVVTGGSGASTADAVSYGVMTVAEALDKLLYLAPLITAFTNDVNTVEIGSTVNAINFNWALNKTVTSQTIDNGIGIIEPGTTTIAVEGLIVTADTVYTLTVDDGTTQEGHTIAKTTNVRFLNKRYVGVSASATLDDAGVIALTGEFASSRAMNKTLDATGGKYLYVAIPTSFACDVNKFKIGGLFNSAWTLVTRAFVNASGHSSSYDIFRTDSIQTGAAINVEIV